ncbi:MAG: hypothetical protein IVW54_09430 [Candidatus Binataceae bacterium]|nr:hypothetical protein [Candidatus Binataceae bacterium]
MVTAAKAFAAIAIISAVGGCAARPPMAPRPVMVKVPVPVPVYCPLSLPDKPRLPISELTPSSTPADTIRAYASAVAILKGAVRQRDQMITGCAAPAANSANNANTAKIAAK